MASVSGVLQFHVLSFEGPDAYASAGGISSRVTGLTYALAELGFDTHLWFIGDASLPGHETRGRLTLHRWCQWISRFHPRGVYDGEEGKHADYAASLPPFLAQQLLPHLSQGGHAVVLAEEWQTADAVLHLDWILRCAGVRDHVTIFWNANNTFGFDRIDWRRLAGASVITTVSRYMSWHMRDWGVEALVIPNGLGAEAFKPPTPRAVEELHRRLNDRLLLAKVARFDPDKRWLQAIEILSALKREEWRPLLVARGGVEAHGVEVLAKAAAAGLRVMERQLRPAGAAGLLNALADVGQADVVVLRSPLDADGKRLLFHAAAAVLANSAHEPFGLVGLETMAAGGLACTGCSGEDYAVAGRNALVVRTSDPREFLDLFARIHGDPEEESAVRHAGQITAEEYRWPSIIEGGILPRLAVAESHGVQA